MAQVFVNGALLSEESAVLSTFDHGLVVGDGAFETLLLHRGRPFALQRHLARLNRSLAGLMIDPIEADAVARAVELVVESCEYSEGRIRITVTAGKGPLGSGRLDSPHSVVVAAAPIAASHEFSQVQTVPWPRNELGALVGLKTISYAENAVAIAYADARGADEAIFANIAGNLCEGSGSNVFVVVDGILITPPLSAGCLAGITRSLVLEYCGGEERDLPSASFHPEYVSEAFLTSAIRGVQPIAIVDGLAFDAVPGPQTLLIQQHYNEFRDSQPNP